MSRIGSEVRLPASAVSRITSEVADYGRRNLETGGFLLGPEKDPMRISVIAMTGTAGVDRGWGLFRVSGKAIEALFEWSEQQDLRIPAQFHSHRYGAFLSPIDQREGFNVLGFISCVIPAFEQPSEDSKKWGWWTFDGTAWVATSPALLGEGDVQVVSFDEDGVRSHA